MATEKIQLFKDGEYKTYERDFAKQPLNLTDWFNAVNLDAVTANYSKAATQNETLTKKDVKSLAEGNIKFIVNYFRNQFTIEEAKEGIKPSVMKADLDRWYNQSAGVMDATIDDGEKLKK